MAMPGSIMAERACIDIVIVNWNAGPLLGRCLSSIATHGGDRVGCVYVVDNGSTDGSADVDVPGLPLVVIRAGANLGFGRACNLAADRGSAPLILLLNPDTELHPGALDQCVARLEQADGGQIGVLGVRLVDEAGAVQRHCGRFPTWRSFVGASLGLSHVSALARRWFPPIIMADFDHLSSRDVDHVIGAFYLVRRDIYRAIGGFDERFFVYLEDLDLSRRIRARGHRIHYFAEPEVYHKRGGTSEQVKAHRLSYALQANLIYAFKHFSRAGAFAVALATYVAEPLARSARAVLRRSPEELGFTWHGFAMLYGATPRLARTLASALDRNRTAIRIDAEQGKGGA
ncbi:MULTISPECIES: glycosyltransferase family 2 protein [unclassified Sphingomonas]|uniref:glycosyltransferase family 2 protein n=1 Tax=unclassified Sphingomonas TaxID=196159 RepID=UPI0012E395C4|nr:MULTISPECIES: glycosyltransferase family 2 protein [unclassified Sphingomonas]